jgi:anti-anti-sigma factor
MKYSVNRNGTAVTAGISGRLTFADAPHYPQFLREVMQGTQSCTIDLSGLEFIDSTGMSLFIHVYDQSRAASVAVTLKGASGAVREVLTRAGFEDLFPFA